MVDVIVFVNKGRDRKELLTWLSKQVGTAKRTRSGNAGGAANGCGADGWGVGWVATKSNEPEVQIQLSSPESPSDSDIPEHFKPEDALVKRAGNGLIHLCFLLPTKERYQDFVDTPVISPSALKAFLTSPRFHGTAKLR